MSTWVTSSSARITPAFAGDGGDTGGHWGAAAVGGGGGRGGAGGGGGGAGGGGGLLDRQPYIFSSAEKETEGLARLGSGRDWGRGRGVIKGGWWEIKRGWREDQGRESGRLGDGGGWGDDWRRLGKAGTAHSQSGRLDCSVLLNRDQ